MRLKKLNFQCRSSQLDGKKTVDGLIRTVRAGHRKIESIVTRPVIVKMAWAIIAICRIEVAVATVEQQVKSVKMFI
jgi:hypothetical protein